MGRIPAVGGAWDAGGIEEKNKNSSRSHYVSHMGLRGVGASKENLVSLSPTMRCATCTGGTEKEHDA